ncbi:MAG: potassium channel family protein [Aureliella sp.]
MLESILVGTLLTMATVCVHAVGTSQWIAYLKYHGKKVQDGEYTRMLPVQLLCLSAAILILLHILEVGIWAVAYLVLPNLESLRTFEEAVYFSTVTFASLGYGDIVIVGPWRLLSAIQAMNGLLLFGWSTALLFAVVERIWSRE